MCESYILKCQCGEKKAELFFGKMLLDEKSVERVFCPSCSTGKEETGSDKIWDNGWLLELNMEAIRQYSSTFGMSTSEITAEWIFDRGYVTWVGITPDDTERRNRERDEIQELAKTDVLAYIKAMKEWGKEREQRFSKEGWRKMRG
jgi:hypothetical protein